MKDNDAGLMAYRASGGRCGINQAEEDAVRKDVREITLSLFVGPAQKAIDEARMRGDSEDIIQKSISKDVEMAKLRGIDIAGMVI